MIEKYFFLLKRNPSLSPEEYTDYWLNKHGPLLASSEIYRSYRRRYVQNHVIGGRPSGIQPFLRFDGVTQVWASSASASAPAFQTTDTYNAVVRPDEEKLLDRHAGIVFGVTEHEIVPGVGNCKVMIFVRRRHDVAEQDFFSYWRGRHAKVVLGQSDFTAYLRGYKQNHVVRGTSIRMTGELLDHATGFDGVVEMWFDSPNSAKLAFDTPGFREVIRADGATIFSRGEGDEIVGDVFREFEIFAS